MSALERQVGGNHYKTTYEHWTLVEKTGMGYLAGCATKYVARWRKKNGVLDLEKARHYLQKLREEVSTSGPPRSFWSGLRPGEATVNPCFEREVLAFAKENQLGWVEASFTWLLVSFRSLEELELADGLLAELICPSDVGAKPVPLTEENHYAERMVPRRDKGLSHKPSDKPSC